MGHSPDNPPDAPPSGASGELTLLPGQWRWILMGGVGRGPWHLTDGEYSGDPDGVATFCDKLVDQEQAREMDLQTMADYPEVRCNECRANAAWKLGLAVGRL